MKIKLLGLYICIAILLSGCGSVGNNLSGAYNATKCEYDYKSITNLSLSGMNLSNGLSLTSVPKIMSILNGTATSIPLDFTLNLDVKNPNTSAAILNGLQYIISIDDIQFTSGRVNQGLSIASGETQTLPINIGVDIAELMKKNSKPAVENIAKNFLGIGTDKSNVKVQIKPTFLIGTTAVTSPIYIPVNFSFGG